MAPDLWVLTVAPGDRAGEVHELRASLPGVPNARFIVVTTQPDPLDGATLLFDSTELNIAKWWTVGLNHIAALAHHEYLDPTQPYDVFITESDTRITPEDLDLVRAEMRRAGCVMGGADWKHLLPGLGVNLVRRSNQAVFPAATRLPGIGLVVAGEVGLRHDPQFRWWLVDDDLEWQAREAGGTVLVGGTSLTHTGFQGELRGERLTAWHEDQPKFMAKWGGMPATGGRVPVPQEA